MDESAPVLDQSTEEPADLSTTEMKSGVAATEEAAIEDQAVRETAAPEQQASSGDRRMRKLAIIQMLAVIAALNGARIIRAHDVAATVEALQAAAAVQEQ